MRADDEARRQELDAVGDGQSPSAALADDLFGVVDVLGSSAALRRALTDPASSSEARVELGRRVFGGKVSGGAQAILEAAFSHRWRNGSVLADAVERQGVRALLRTAEAKGQLDQVIDGLVGFATTVRRHDGLREALRDETVEADHRRTLVSTLTASRVDAVTEALLGRAVNQRERTFVLTVDSYVQAAAELRNRRVAHVTVARPLDDSQAERLRRLLAKQVGGDVDLQVEVDPSVLGGVRVQFGDDRIDSTFASRLDDAQRQLIG